MTFEAKTPNLFLKKCLDFLLLYTFHSSCSGATILENLEKQHDLKQQLKVYANVRNEEQAAFAESAGYHAAWIDNSDKAAMKEFFLSNKGTF